MRVVRGIGGPAEEAAGARQMLSVGLQGLAGSSQFRCNLDTPSAEPLPPGFRHSDVPFAASCATDAVNKLSPLGEHRRRPRLPSSHTHTDSPRPSRK